MPSHRHGNRSRKHITEPQVREPGEINIVAKSPGCDGRNYQPGDNSQLGCRQCDTIGNRAICGRDLVAMARLSLMALGQESLVGVVDTADEGFGSNELNRRKPGTSGEIARPVIFDTDPLVETGCSEINDVHTPIVLPLMLLRESSDRE